MSEADCNRAIAVMVFAAVAWTVAPTAHAGSAAVLGRNVNPSQRIAAERIDHSRWTELLKKYVDERGMVDYASWQAAAADMKALDDYLDHLSAASFARRTDKDVKLAFWINAYNALTIKGILREYPTTSIRNHTAKVFGYNIWKDLKLLVEGRPHSLDEMEHEVLRKMGEPRIHFAIVCAAMGCPRLLNEAYVPDELDKQLDANGREFFANPRKFRYDAEGRTIAVSPILNWFGEDFGGNSAEQMRRIAPFLPDVAARRLAESGTVEVSFLDYDWSLNDQAKSNPAATR
jgi:hypothetical protein